jgi:predicted PurR-regulated permease PerM
MLSALPLPNLESWVDDRLAQDPPLSPKFGMAFPGPTPKQATLLWTALSGLAIAVILGLLGAFFTGMGWLANQLSSVLLPLAVAGIIAYLLDPVVDWLERHRIGRTWAIMMVFAMALVLQVAFFAAFVPSLIKDTKKLGESIPQIRQKAVDKYVAFSQEHPFKQYVPDPFQGILDWLTPSPEATSQDTQTGHALETTKENDLITSESTATPEVPPASGQATQTEENTIALNADQIGDVANALWRGLVGLGEWIKSKIQNVASMFGMLAGFALVPVYVFYFLAEKNGIQRNWTRYLPVHDSWIKEEIVFVLHSINDALIVFFRGQVLVAMCVGGLLMIGFWLIGLSYAVLLGFVAGILGIVPYLGVMLSIVPALIISMVENPGWYHPALTLGIFVLVQMAEGLVISPRIIGDRVGMHPLTVIIAIMIGTTLMGGIIGGVLAIPLTAALRTLMFRYVWTESPLSLRRRPVSTTEDPLAKKD